MLCGADGDSIGYYAAENLTYAVKAKPNVDTGSLFVFGVPLP
jgi:hypothetical protein